MNRSFRSVWNADTSTFVAVAENVCSAGKALSSQTGRLHSRAACFALTTLSLSLLIAFGAPAQAAPTGADVRAGSASIAGAGGNTTITQTSQNVAIDWQSFNIGANEAVRFVQPNSSSVALNRVLGTDPSSILGSLTANGRVFLVNPNGILFGKGASVNVGGLVASTLGITDNDFMAGRYRFTGRADPGDLNDPSNPSKGSVLNQGAIHADGGYVALLGARVTNQGTISAKLGSVALAAGNAITLDLAGDGLLNVTVDRGALNALVDNRGLIQAGGGHVLLTAQSAGGLLSTVVNNSGVIEAGSITDHGGVIRLTADEVHLAGTLDASGKTGGGRLEIGGGWQGSGSLLHAQTVTVQADAKLLANATELGDGGTISVWSDGATKVAGTLSATGGARGGSGGNIETSGHQLNVTGIAVDASAPLGAAGSWLLDPYNLTVSGGATTATQSPAGTWTSNAGGSVVLNTNINSALNSGTSVVLQTSGTLGDGLGNGDITVSSAIAKTSGAATSLTLKAAGSIIVNAGISSSVGALDVTLDANTVGGGGYVNVAAPITTLGGNLVIGGGVSPLTGNAVGNATLGNGVTIGAALTTGGGAITINGAGNSATTGNYQYGVSINSVAVDAGGGNISITGTGGGTGASFANYGVQESATSSIATSGAGTISITGTGGGAGGTGFSNTGLLLSGTVVAGGGAIAVTGSGGNSSGASNYGIQQSGAISNSGAGGIILNGTGGGTGGAEFGLYGTANISAGTGNISLIGNSSATATAGSDHGVILAGGTTSTTGAGTVTIAGTATGSGTGGSTYGVQLSGGAVVTTVDGLLSVTGTNNSTGTSSNNHGVYITGVGSAIRSTGAGGVTVTGSGGGAGAGGGDRGVEVGAANGIQTTGTGAISITGTGGDTGGTGGFNHGVYWTNSIAAAGGSISISGTGGNATGGNNYGIQQAAALSTSGAGNITFNGIGGNSSGAANIGILLAASTTTTGTGSITLNGTGGGTGNSEYGLNSTANISAGTGNISLTGGASATATGGSDHGVILAGGTTSTTGAGTVTIAGTATGSSTGGSTDGVQLSGGAVVTTVDGLLKVTGTNNSAGTGGSNRGVYITGAGSAIRSSGTGGVTVIGVGGGSGTGGNSHGVVLNAANGIQTTGAGAISLTGTGGDAGGNGSTNYGVYLNGTLAGAGGAISITGTGGNSSGASNAGILQPAAVSNSGSGSITLNGTGGGTGTNAYGIGSQANISAGTGGISITGVASATATGGSNSGLFFAGGTTSTTGAGTVTIAGTATGNGTGSNTYGVQVSTGSVISTVGGLVSVTGTNNSTGTGAGNHGVYITGAGSAIRSTGAGGVTVIGFGGGSGAGGAAGDVGVYLNAANGVQTTGTGAISITGTGGDAGGSGANNHGVYLNGTLAAAGGAIAVTGTGGSSSSGANTGIYQPAAVTNTGSGSITFNGTGGSGSTFGYSGVADVTSGTGNISFTGNAGNPTTGSGYGVKLAGGTVSTSGTGSISIAGTAAGSGSTGGAFAVQVSGGVVVTTLDGPISVTGTNNSTGTGAGNHGIYISGAGSTIRSTGAGSVTMNGVGGGSGAGGADYGVWLGVANGIQTTGTGAISISGTGGDTGGSGANNYGVYLNNALASAGGAISITGTGGSASGAGNYGIYQLATVSNTGAGSITFGGTGGTGSSPFGYVGSADVTSGTGNISLTGNGGTPTTGGSGWGVSLTAGTISTGSTGTITIAGTATGSGTATNTYGVSVNSGTVVSTLDGLVSVTGTNNSNATGANNLGVYITSAGSAIKSTGAGGVTVTGLGGGSGAGGTDAGVWLDVANGIQATGSGAIAITGTGGDTGGTGINNYGVYLKGALAGAGGAISVTGTGGNSSGAGNYGIKQIATVSNTGVGSITLSGTGGGTGTSETGLSSTANISAGTGNISLTGVASGTATGASNHGVIFAGGNTSTTGAGTVTIAGTATGTGSGSNTYGVQVSAGSVVSTVGGLLNVTGTNNSTGTGADNDGVYITGAGSAIRSTGAGSVAVAGAGGGSGAGGTDYGVWLDVANGIQATGTGAISITGTGGDASGSGTNNYGVYLPSALSSAGGAISITGTGGSSSGGGNQGLSLAAVAAGTGTLTLTSTGAATGSGALTGAKLNLLGTGGSYTLTNGGNAVTTLAANTGSVNYAQTGDLVIGTIGSTAGVTSTGPVLVNVAGNLTLATGAGVSATGSGNALNLVDSGSFNNNAGANALSVAGGGRWLVWSATPASDTRGGLAYGFKQYGASYGTTTPAASASNGFLYSVNPTVSIGLTGSVSKTYDGNTTATLAAGNYTAGGLDGDTVNLNNPSAGNYDTVNVGTAKTVTVTGLTVASASNGVAPVYGYALSSSTVSGPVGSIGQRAITVTADAKTQTYGDLVPALTQQVTSGSLVSGDALSGAASTVATSASHVGTYPIQQSSVTAGSNYALTFSNGTLTVTPAPLVLSADNQSKTYGSTFSFTGSEFSAGAGQLRNGDSIGSVSLTSSGSVATAGVASGPYAITPSSATGGTFAASDYSISYGNGALTVNPASITVTASNASKTYGQTPTLSGFTSTALQNGETIGSATETSSGTAATASVLGGPYAITPSGATGGTFTASNYTIGYANGTLTVNPASITVTASNASKTYGQTPTLSGFTSTALQNGETIGSVTETSSGTAATASVLGGPYAITPSGATGGTFTASNYTIGYANGTLTVNPASITVTASDASKTYGQTPTLSGFTSTALQNGETIGSVTETSAGTAATASVLGGPYAITPSNATGGTFTASNYTIGYANGALTVNPAALTVTSSNASKTYGQTPTLSGFTSTALQNGETIGSVTETSAGTAATASVLGGPYAITPSNATGGTFTASNYTIGYANGALTVNPASITVTANDAAKTYGQTPTLSGFTSTALQNGETIGSVTETSAGTAASASVAGGPYAITASNANGGTFTASNYTIDYLDGALSVGKALLTLTANPAFMVMGSAVPPLSGSITGFVAGDTQASATTGTLAFTTAATATWVAGRYAINGSGLTPNGNYNINQAASNATALEIGHRTDASGPKVSAVRERPAAGCTDSLAGGGSVSKADSGCVPAPASSARGLAGLNLGVVDGGIRLPPGATLGTMPDAVVSTRQCHETIGCAPAP